MLAVDTNILVRLLVQDDRRQFATVKALLSGKLVWVAKTVLLETNWVLSDSYRYTREEILAAFKGLLGLENLRLEDPGPVTEAIRLMGHGLDFADALHLCSRGPSDQFLTFDAKLVRRASKAGVDAVTQA